MADIVTTAEESGQFGTLVAAIKAAGLADALKAPGPLTVFAPTEAAFKNALTAMNKTADELLADTESLTKILKYHVVSGKYMASDVAALEDGTTVDTLQGEPITIYTKEGVKVNDANVTQTDIMADNGVIHVVDKVLMPKM